MNSQTDEAVEDKVIADKEEDLKNEVGYISKIIGTRFLIFQILY